MLLRIGFHLSWPLFFLISTISSQQKQNRSCKEFFRYAKDNKTSQPVGILTVPQDGSDVVEFKANLSVPMLLDTTVNVGARLLSSKSDFMAGEPLTYMIYFPPNLPIPTLLGVELNHNYVCSDELIMSGMAHTIIMTKSVIRLERISTTDGLQTTPPDGGLNTTPFGTFTTALYPSPPPVTSTPPPSPVYPPPTYPPQVYPPPTYPPPINLPPPLQYPPPVYQPHPPFGFGQYPPVPSMPFLTSPFSPFPFPYGFQPYILAILVPSMGSPFPYFAPNFGYPWHPNLLHSRETLPISHHGPPNSRLNYVSQSVNANQHLHPFTYGNFNPNFGVPNQFFNPARVAVSPPPALSGPHSPLQPLTIRGNPAQYQPSGSQPLQGNSLGNLKPSNLSFRFLDTSPTPFTPIPLLNSDDPEWEDEPVPFALL